MNGGFNRPNTPEVNTRFGKKLQKRGISWGSSKKRERWDQKNVEGTFCSHRKFRYGREKPKGEEKGIAK